MYDSTKGIHTDGLDWFKTDQLELSEPVTIYYEVMTKKLFHVFLGNVDLYWVLNESSFTLAKKLIQAHIGDEVEL